MRPITNTITCTTRHTWVRFAISLSHGIDNSEDVWRPWVATYDADGTLEAVHDLATGRDHEVHQERVLLLHVLPQPF